MNELFAVEQIKKKFLQAEFQLKNSLNEDPEIKQECDLQDYQNFETYQEPIAEFDQNLIEYDVKTESEDYTKPDIQKSVRKKKKVKTKKSLIVDSENEPTTGKKSIRCQICKLVVDRADLRNHNLEMHKNILTCEICDITMSSKDTFRKHLRNHMTYDEPLHVCQGCGEKFYLTRHFIIHKCAVKPICHLCQLSFSCRKEILSHIQDNHMDEDCYNCKEANCSFTTKRTETYFYHLAGHFDPVDRLCEVCSQSFSDLRTYHAHRLKHKKITTRFHCDICGHKVRRKANLIRHFRTSHIKTRFQCDLCNRLYTDPAVLKQHKVTKHNLEAPYKCDACNISFIYQSMLKNHQRLHMKGYAFKPKKTAEERKNMTFQCTTCFKIFKNEPNLKRHNDTVHLKIKKYFCPTCEKAFSQKTALETHLRIHSG